jgi:hypothetical protein
LQHTPSAQKADKHSVAEAQAEPLFFLGSHLPRGVQKRPGAQPALDVQPEGQVPADPVQRYGAQDGLPDEPSSKVTQAPTESTRLQASHCPAQGALQHTPSTQKPEMH